MKAIKNKVIIFLLVLAYAITVSFCWLEYRNGYFVVIPVKLNPSEGAHTPAVYGIYAVYFLETKKDLADFHMYFTTASNVNYFEHNGFVNPDSVNYQELAEAHVAKNHFQKMNRSIPEDLIWKSRGILYNSFSDLLPISDTSASSYKFVRGKLMRKEKIIANPDWDIYVKRQRFEKKIVRLVLEGMEVTTIK